MKTDDVIIDYTNHRGERGERTISPATIWWGSTEWHPETQWLLTAIETTATEHRARTFAMKDIHSWRPA